jgi:hypothetical protein
MSASSAPLSTPEGLGSVSSAPNLPAGFNDTFTGRYIDAGGLRQHTVIPGAGHWLAEEAPRKRWRR